MAGHYSKTGRKVHGHVIHGPFCGLGDSYPADTVKRAKSAIQRASQFGGKEKRQIQKCACSVLANKFGRTTPTCRKLGFRA